VETKQEVKFRIAKECRDAQASANHTRNVASKLAKRTKLSERRAAMTDEERAEDVAGAKRVKIAKQTKNAASMSGGHKFAPDIAALERFGTLVPWSEMARQAAYTTVFHMLLQQPGMLFVIASTDGIVPADNTKEHVMREVPGGPQTVRRVVYLESVNQPWVGEALFDQPLGAQLASISKEQNGNGSSLGYVVFGFLLASVTNHKRAAMPGMAQAFGEHPAAGGYINGTAFLLKSPLYLGLSRDEPIWARNTLLEACPVVVRRCAALKKLMAVAHACFPHFAALKPDAAGEPCADLTHNIGLGVIRLCHYAAEKYKMSGAKCDLYRLSRRPFKST
jgi:hypothetical protein